MNNLLKMLSGGDLRSDGLANEVVKLVLEQPTLLGEITAGLEESDDVIRGRTADALEKISREKPEDFLPRLPQLIHLARTDPLPMVRWHMAMILTNLLPIHKNNEQIESALSGMLQDRSAIVRSWAVSGLCILGRKYTDKRRYIIASLSGLERDPSIAVRHRAAKALRYLLNDALELPAGWNKSKNITSKKP